MLILDAAPHLQMSICKEEKVIECVKGIYNRVSTFHEHIPLAYTYNGVSAITEHIPWAYIIG